MTAQLKIVEIVLGLRLVFIMSTSMIHLSKTSRCKQMEISKRKNGGYTLIELMVVIVIIGVLGALVVPSVINRVDDAKVTAAKTDVANLYQALKLYRLDNSDYPTAEQGLQALVTRPTAAPVPNNWKQYVDKLPSDPWGRAYIYARPGINGEVDVLSFGADGQSGGEGKNADIGSWQ